MAETLKGRAAQKMLTAERNRRMTAATLALKGKQDLFEQRMWLRDIKRVINNAEPRMADAWCVHSNAQAKQVHDILSPIGINVEIIPLRRPNRSKHVACKSEQPTVLGLASTLETYGIVLEHSMQRISALERRVEELENLVTEPKHCNGDGS